MKKVLIATTNKDKYSAVSKIFKATIFKKEEYSILSLYDIDVNLKDEKECGSNIERARMKAKSAYNQLKDYDFDYFVGLDDAIKIKGKIEPNIKEYLNKILYDNYLSDGEEYAFNRAYCICDKEGNIYEANADIPYIYHPLKNNYELEKFTYPLSRVAYPIGVDKPICDITGDDEINYYLRYVKDALLSLDLNKRQERFDVLDKDRKHLGYTKVRGEKLDDNEYNVGIELWIFNNGKLLMTQRSMQKSHPGEWEVPGGCSQTNESSFDTLVREASEEIGLTVHKEDFELIDTQIYKKQFVDIYKSNIPVDLDKIILQDEEVSAVKFATKDEFLKMASNNEIVKSVYSRYENIAGKLEKDW